MSAQLVQEYGIAKYMNIMNIYVCSVSGVCVYSLASYVHSTEKTNSIACTIDDAIPG